jgi:hypothetical protein
MDSFVIVYLDDILIYSKSPEDHEKHLRAVLSALRQHKLYAKISKCTFGVTETEFLGHIVSDKGISTDPRKIQAVRDWPTPRTVTELRSFLGLANYYRRFVQGYSRIAGPLTSLTGKGCSWMWGEAQDAAFQTLKQALINAHILSPPDFTKPFTVRCDASDFAIGAVLAQGEGDSERVVAYESRKLAPAEINYLVHEKELLSVVHSLKLWRHYLQGSQFTVITDNWAVRHVQSQPQLTRRQARWMELLQEYDFVLEHRPGATNVVLDALSRRPDLVNALCMAVCAVSEVRPTDDILATVRATAPTDPQYVDVLAVVSTHRRSDF